VNEAVDEDDLMDERGPERTCIVTRRKGSPEAMLRFVVGPDGQVVPDLRRRLPGRGVWVTAAAGMVAEAQRKGAFARGFRRAVTVSPTLAADVGALMEREALQALSLANKAGSVITGFAKVEAEIAAHRIAGLVHARDGGEDGVRKLTQALLRHHGEAALGWPRVRLFDSGQLDLALGRTNVIHAALKTGAASDSFLSRSHALAVYRGGTALEQTETTAETQAPRQGSAPTSTIKAGTALGSDTNE
jgi:predicted RNA-binding protein YlxR (DUF448 family)